MRHVCFFFFFFVFSLQYSEKALYNQLSFYRFIFDWEYATTKVLLGEEKCKMAAIFNPHYKRAHTDAHTAQAGGGHGVGVEKEWGWGG